MTARRGSNEIASCFFQYIQTSIAEGMKELRSFSDSCSGQNRNRFMFVMMHLAAVRFNIKICHQFMQPGHTQNEKDSLHARIEQSADGKDLFEFNDVVELIKTANVNDPPYRLTVMKQEQIFDFKQLVDLQNWKYADHGQEVKWSKVRVLEFNGSEPGLVKYKYDYAGDFMCIKVNARRGRPVNVATYPLPKAYNGRIPLPFKKVRALKSLCNQLSIPSKYHNFWKNVLLTPAQVQEETLRNSQRTADYEDGSWAQQEEDEEDQDEENEVESEAESESESERDEAVADEEIEINESSSEDDSGDEA